MNASKLLFSVIGLFIFSCNSDMNRTSGMKETTKAEQPLTCKLTSDELVQREAQLKKEIFSKIKKTRELEDGFEFEFHEDAAFSSRLVEFINLERDCCPFFTFTLTFEPQAGAVKVKIGNSKEIREMIKSELEDNKLI